jgi:hypothetical protein
MDERRWERLGAALGVLVVVLVVVAVFLTGSPPKSTASDARIKAYLVDKRGAMLTQAFLIAFALALFLWFAGLVRGVLRRAEGHTHLADVFFGAALVNTAVTFGAAALNAGLVYKALPGTSDGVARMVYDMSGMLFTLAGVLWAVAAVAFAVTVFATEVLPSWTAWMAELSAVASIVGMFIIFSKTGSFSLEGTFSLVPFALSMLWILGTSVAMLRPEMAHAPTHRAAPSAV